MKTHLSLRKDNGGMRSILDIALYRESIFILIRASLLACNIFTVLLNLMGLMDMNGKDCNRYLQ